MDSSQTSLLEQVSTSSTVTEEKKDLGPVVDKLVNRMVDDILAEVDKYALLQKLQVSDEIKDEGEYFDTYFGFDLEGKNRCNTWVIMYICRLSSFST